MKNLLSMFLIVFSSLLPIHFNSLISKADSPIYAKVEMDNIFLYSSPNDNNENKLFILPKTYFVKLLNEANNNFYHCSYKDIKGYVKKSQVVAMAGTPAHPFVEGLFRTFSLEGLGIYSSPEFKKENCLTTIPYLTDNLIYYGRIIGQEIPDKSSEWIYCKYKLDNEICGYVYSVFCDKLPTVSVNTENFEIIANPFSKNEKPKELSPVSMGFIIAGVAIPCLIVLFLLVKPTLNKEKLNTIKPQLRAKRNRDFFEFDDSDLN